MMTSNIRIVTSFFGLLVGLFVAAKSAYASDWFDAPKLNDSGVFLQGEGSFGVVPPFRAGSRNRLDMGLYAFYKPVEKVYLDASYSYLMDFHPDGSRVAGLGDLRLGTNVTFWSTTFGGLLGGWRIKLPNASDEQELGSDEADTTLIVSGFFQRAEFKFYLSAGILILGNPYVLAAQDDALIVDLTFSYDQEKWSFLLSNFWIKESPWNPHRGESSLELMVGNKIVYTIKASFGWVPASPDLTIGVGLGRTW